MKQHQRRLLTLLQHTSRPLHPHPRLVAQEGTLEQLSRHPHCARHFSGTSRRHADFTHAVIGGGAVGLAIARRLQSRGGSTSTILIERHRSVGTETSSRNSEVIHAGLYYGANTLKTELCLKGKQALYALCEKHSIPYRNCGKWIVAQTKRQLAELEKLHILAASLDIPIHFLTLEQGKQREPDVQALSGILESPTTGILDSHAYMQFLHGDFSETLGGETALGTRVTRIEAIDGGTGGWRIFTSSSSPGEEEEDSITAETIINSAGLGACAISNMILPPERHRTQYYAKGSYFSYAAAHPRPQTLIYPAPEPGHGGLGTHLTLDMAGRIRFGPDVEWVDSPDDLAPNQSPERLKAALDDIRAYLPGLDTAAIDLDYAGIRPKLARGAAVGSGGKRFMDFHIQTEPGFEGFVNLLGIESPGLTSSLAIADLVHDLLYK